MPKYGVPRQITRVEHCHDKVVEKIDRHHPRGYWMETVGIGGRNRQGEIQFGGTASRDSASHELDSVPRQATGCR